MLLRYKPANDTHIKIVPLLAATEKRKKTRLSRRLVQLLPGVNEVTDDEWEVMSAHLARELKDKTIVIIEKAAAKSGAGGDDKAKNLREVPTNDAYDLIDECVNPETLRKWLREETRDELRLDIVERMKKLKIEPVARERKKSGTTGNEADAADDAEASETGDEPAKEGRRGKGNKPKTEPEAARKPAEPELEPELAPERDDAA